ncbi:high mobility group box domain-containing protein, partial [Pterulicium gracile]
SWVPRPANCFILFRSEFSKLHCRANSDGDTPLDKTLSKRAAEKWRTMSAQEKQKYQKMAEVVRAEHAEQYPNYQFHPAKRSTQKKRK